MDKIELMILKNQLIDMKLAAYKEKEDLMKRLLLPPLFKRFKKSAFFSSLNQNTCPVYDAEEIKKQEQQEAIKKLYP